MSKVRWLFYRLRAMGPAEILHRVIEQLKRKISARRDYTHAFDGIGDGVLPALQIDEIALADKALMKVWKASTQKAQAGTYAFLGVQWPATKGPAKWHLDPVSGQSWPSEPYCYAIPYRHEKEKGDIKYVWELNRWQHLHPMAALARATSDETLAREVIEDLLEWEKANPVFKGVNWSSGIELALRVVGLSIILGLLGPLAEKVITPAERTTLRRMMAAHGYWLQRYPSKFSSANNHLVAEGAGLFILGALCPDMPHAKAYAAEGRHILEAEVLKQIFADGVGAEQSPTYTAFTLEFMLISSHVAAQVGKPFSKAFYARLEKAAEALRWVTDSAGNQPHIGDNDEGRVIVNLLGQEEGYTSSVLACLAALIERPDLAPPVVPAHLRNLILGAAKPSAKSPEGLKAFEQGGYTVVRQTLKKQPVMLVMDNGPLGYLSIAAHGHADALALWLHVGGTPVLADAGTYLYHAGHQWRSYFRSTAAHNTLELDNQSQSTMSGPFNWSQKAKAWLVNKPISGKEWQVQAQHDGYKRFGIIHQRMLQGTATGFDVADSLQGTPTNPSAEAVLRYLIGPACKVKLEGPHKALISTPEGAKVAVTCTLPLALEKAPYSAAFGHKGEALVLVARTTAENLVQTPADTRFEIV